MDAAENAKLYRNAAHMWEQEAWKARAERDRLVDLLRRWQAEPYSSSNQSDRERMTALWDERDRALGTLERTYEAPDAS